MCVGTNNGWIELHRALLENPVVMKSAEHCAIWNCLLLMATHTDRDVIFDGKRITLKKGQLITGRKILANLFHRKISESKVQRILKDFENEHQIEQQTCSQNRLITIVNWELYQKHEQPSEQQMNNDRTTSEQRVNTNNNDNNYNNDNNNINKGKPKPKKEPKIFKPPTVDEVRVYCQERGNFVDPESFINFYESKGWMVGSNEMKDWKAAVRTWESKDKKRGLIPKQNQSIKTVRIEKQPKDETTKFPYYGLPKEWFKGDMITSALIGSVRDADTGKEFAPDEIVDLYYLRRERALGDEEDLEFRHGT